MKTEIKDLILPIGIVLLLASIAKKFGLIKDTEAEEQQNKQQFSNYFNPNFYIQLNRKGNIKLFTQAGADYVATEIYNSKGLFNDAEDRLISAIKNFRYKTQVSQTAAVFAKKYKRDMATYLQGFLNEDERKTIFNYTDKLPTGNA